MTGTFNSGGLPIFYSDVQDQADAFANAAAEEALITGAEGVAVNALESIGESLEELKTDHIAQLGVAIDAALGYATGMIGELEGVDPGKPPTDDPTSM